MATKKKTKKKTKAKKRAVKKVAPKRKTAKKKSAAKKPVAAKSRSRAKGRKLNTVAFTSERREARPGRLAGDLQGLSDLEGPDSESVDELLEEGNAFEAEAVKGVEDAEDADESEVHTHEVPEDDVPGEYLDEDE